MSVTSGFFNSLDGDRKYNAEQMSAIFDGIINDGVFENIGTAFGVTASSGTTVTVGIGRAWFNSTWVYNDALISLTLDSAEVLLDRYDAVVIEVDRSESVRAADIKIVKGTAASSPKRPTLEDSTYVHQYPLAYILMEAGSSEITQDNITSMVGKSACPYITGILEVLSIDNIVAQWEAQWNKWYANTTSDGESDISAWLSEQQATFNTWFSSLQATLSDDVAANLASQILELQGNWSTLATEYCIYQTLEDADGDGIEDSYDDSITTRIMYKLA